MITLKNRFWSAAYGSGFALGIFAVTAAGVGTAAVAGHIPGIAIAATGVFAMTSVLERAWERTSNYLDGPTSMMGAALTAAIIVGSANHFSPV